MVVLRVSIRSPRMQPHKIATSSAIDTRPSRVILAIAIGLPCCNSFTKLISLYNQTSETAKGVTSSHGWIHLTLQLVTGSRQKVSTVSRYLHLVQARSLTRAVL
jgi:hypothetical protein